MPQERPLTRIIGPSLIDAAADVALGPTSLTRPTAGSDYFADTLVADFRSLAQERTLQFEQLPLDAQGAMFLAFLRNVTHFTEEALARERLGMRAEQPTMKQAFFIYPDPVTLNLQAADGESTAVHLKTPYKIGLTYLALLTKAKLDRFLNPEISANELLDYMRGLVSLDQLRDHLLKPLDHAGLLESRTGKGYRLLGSADTLLARLKSPVTEHVIEQEDREEWAKTYKQAGIIDEYHLPYAIVLAGYHGSDQSTPLPLDEISRDVGRSYGQTSIIFQELRDRGLLTKRGIVYRTGDINIRAVMEIIGRNQDPIDLVVVTQTNEQRLLATYPKTTWGERFPTTLAQDDTTTNFLRLRSVLTAPVAPQMLTNAQNVHIYSGPFPHREGLSIEDILIALDSLGIGPKELELISKENGFTSLAAILRSCEQRIELADFLNALKMRFSLLLGQGEITMSEASKRSAGYYFGLLVEATKQAFQREQE